MTHLPDFYGESIRPPRGFGKRKVLQVAAVTATKAASKQETGADASSACRARRGQFGKPEPELMKTPVGPDCFPFAGAAGDHANRILE
jgi:hypothetical protein